MNFWLKNKLNTPLLPPNWYLIISSFFLSHPAFFESGMIKLSEDIPSSAPTAVSGVGSLAHGRGPMTLWMSQGMKEDINEQGHQLSGEEAFLGSTFTISSHSHRFFLATLFQRRAAAGLFVPYQGGTSMPRVSRTSEAPLPLTFVPPPCHNPQTCSSLLSATLLNHRDGNHWMSLQILTCFLKQQKRRKAL